MHWPLIRSDSYTPISDSFTKQWWRISKENFMARSQKRREQCFLSSPRNPLQTLVNKPSHTFLSTYSHSQTGKTRRTRFSSKSVLQLFIYEYLTDLNFFFQKSTASWSQNPDFCCAQSMSPLGVQLYIQDRHVYSKTDHVVISHCLFV